MSKTHILVARAAISRGKNPAWHILASPPATGAPARGMCPVTVAGSANTRTVERGAAPAGGRLCVRCESRLRAGAAPWRVVGPSAVDGFEAAHGEARMIEDMVNFAFREAAEQMGITADDYAHQRAADGWATIDPHGPVGIALMRAVTTREPSADEWAAQWRLYAPAADARLTRAHVAMWARAAELEDQHRIAAWTSPQR